MPLVGCRYIQSSDPGAPGVGYEWLNPTTGDLTVRNLSNTAWVAVGNISQANYGHVPLTGAAMSGPLTGVTSWAPVADPDFQGVLRNNGNLMASMDFVTQEINNLSQMVNDRISEAIVAATSGINVKSNITMKMVTGENLYASVPTPYTAPYTRTVATVTLPLYANGLEADPLDCYAFCFDDIDNGRIARAGGRYPGTATTYIDPGTGYAEIPFDGTGADNDDTSYRKIYAGTPTSSGVPILVDAWTTHQGTTQVSIPAFNVRWKLLIIAVKA